ncbi:acyl-CoA dehydrogenase family protein [Acrocarpospora catenulata]|uniref:acyl-CoA dehydrogenase family protein n=1 Tax=Acrocarpospora catenulata TaxID=2836182 RepID=UPI001BDA67EC|nr:acyl-CoA dehydrogenase family protein [Acrocarpospora catenulata]
MTPYTPSWYDDELRDVGAMAREFFERSVLPHQERFARQHQVDRETWLQAGAQGLLCPSLPEEYGGGGGTFAHEAVILWEQGRAGDDSLPYAIHSTIVPHYVHNYGTEEQKRRWLPRLAGGETVGAIAMTEPSTGSDLKEIRTTARREGEEYVLDGAKTFITNGAMAGLILVVARTGGPGARGLSIIAIEGEEVAGLTRGRPLDKIGQRGQDTRELAFEGVRVPARNLVGAQGQGFAQLMAQLPQERLAIAIGAVAQAELAVDLAVAYAKERQAFGGSLWDLQNTRFVLAECATQVLAARTFLDHCVTLHLDARLDAATASQVKLLSTDMLSTVADRCLQVFGGYGYVMEYPIARIFAGARVQRIYGGANEVMKELVARSM